MRLIMIALLSLTACVAVLSAESHAADESFTPLFDGQTLDGWTRKGGDAEYHIEPDAPGGAQVVGVSKLNTHNTFLCTDKEYGDFVLQFEVKVDPSLNSGVQFRSAWSKESTTYELEQADGSVKTIRVSPYRVHGYQVEIDPSKRAWSGGIYDEGRRGWIFNLEGKDEARKAFDPEGWNRYRVEAIGDHIRTFVNDVPVADFHDPVSTSGFIALQVHSIGKEADAGKVIRWRNIHICEK